MTQKIAHVSEDDIHMMWSDLGMIVLDLGDVAHNVEHPGDNMKKLMELSDRIQKVRQRLHEFERSAK